MTMWSMLLFWIPVCIGIVAFCYFVKHSRTNKLLMLSFLPIVFFIVQIVKYTYIESQEIFIFYVVGLFISVVFFIMILSYFYKNKFFLEVHFFAVYIAFISTNRTTAIFALLFASSLSQSIVFSIRITAE